MAAKRKHLPRDYDDDDHPRIANLVMRAGCFERDIAGALAMPRHIVGYWKTRHLKFKLAIRWGQLAAWAAALRPDLDPLITDEEEDLWRCDRRKLLRAAKERRKQWSDEDLYTLESELIKLWYEHNDEPPIGDLDCAVLWFRSKGIEPDYSVPPNGHSALRPLSLTHQLTT